MIVKPSAVAAQPPAAVAPPHQNRPLLRSVCSPSPHAETAAPEAPVRCRAAPRHHAADRTAPRLHCSAAAPGIAAQHRCAHTCWRHPAWPPHLRSPPDRRPSRTGRLRPAPARRPSRSPRSTPSHAPHAQPPTGAPTGARPGFGQRPGMGARPGFGQRPGPGGAPGVMPPPGEAPRPQRPAAMHAVAGSNIRRAKKAHEGLRAAVAFRRSAGPL